MVFRPDLTELTILADLRCLGSFFFPPQVRNTVAKCCFTIFSEKGEVWEGGRTEREEDQTSTTYMQILRLFLMCHISHAVLTKKPLFILICCGRACITFNVMIWSPLM